MGSITSKSIRPQKSGVGFAVNDTPDAATFAAIDKQLATYGLDRTGDTISNATILLAQDPNSVSVFPTITGGILVTGPTGSVAGTGSAGTLLLNNNDIPSYSSPRTRTVLISPLEIMQTTVGGPNGANAPSSAAVVIDGRTGGVSQAPTTAYSADQAGQFIFPLTKPMDGWAIGSSFSSVTVYFYVPTQPAAVGVSSNQIYMSVRSIQISNGTETVIAVCSADLDPTPSGWFASGSVQSITVNSSSGNVSGGGIVFNSATPFTVPTILDLSTYTYNIQFNGPDLSSPSFFPSPIVTCISVTYNMIDGERFAQ